TRAEDTEVRVPRSAPAMRDPRTRTALVGLILALPPFMVAAAPRGPSARAAAAPVLLVEVVLVAGLTVAARGRARLQPRRAVPTTAGPPPALRFTTQRRVRRAPAGRLWTEGRASRARGAT